MTKCVQLFTTFDIFDHFHFYVPEFDRECRQRDALNRKPEALVSETERLTLQDRDIS